MSTAGQDKMSYDEAVCQRHCFQKMNVFVGTLDLSESAYHYYLDKEDKQYAKENPHLNDPYQKVLDRLDEEQGLRKLF